MATAHDKTHALVRLETFSDAVFAVAMTVLVLDLRSPEISAAVRANRFDFSFLVHEVPHFIAFLVSFLLLAINWMVLVNFFRGVTRATWEMMWMTMIYLLFVCLVPWSTALVASNPTLPQAVAVYAVVLTCAGVPGFWLSRYLDRVFPVAEPRSFRVDSAMLLLGLVSSASAFVTVYIPFAILILSSVLYFTPKRIRRRLFPYAAAKSKDPMTFTVGDYSI